jgi:uncharacterized damage-inducible protein DinB
MAIKDAFLAELKFETDSTRKMLERVPMDKKEWKPDEKSMSVGRLATHIAETFSWISEITGRDEFNFMTDYKHRDRVETDNAGLLSLFDKTVSEAVSSLEKTSDEDFAKIWTVKAGEKVMSAFPKKVAIRGWAFSHLIHHRGQLSVYLRLLGIPVPGMYGPSADER